MADDLNYGSYLHLDTLLGLQQPRSVPEHPDELLFIVVHQASELWFKVLLHELRGLHHALDAQGAPAALAAIRRVNTLVGIVANELASLETLPPQRFAEFRGYLGRSSGSQSAQFRAIEALSGLRDPRFLQAIRDHGEPPRLVLDALDGPTLQDRFLALVAREGASLEGVYADEAQHQVLFLLAESLLEYEQAFARWRFGHVQLVERIIGPDTGGTGGTLGARYLARTVQQRFFPELWKVRSSMYRG